jgi:hypothetical protein
MDVIGVVDLQHEDESHHLDAEFSPVHVVSQKEIMLVWHVPEFLKDVK